MHSNYEICTGCLHDRLSPILVVLEVGLGGNITLKAQFIGVHYLHCCLSVSSPT